MKISIDKFPVPKTLIRWSLQTGERLLRWGRSFDSPRDLIYGFDSETNILPGATVTLSTAPQKRHVPKRLVVSESIGRYFAISAIAVGVEPTLATVGNMSMAVFVEDNHAPDFRPIVCEVGMDVSLVITNTSKKPRRFLATMIGREVAHTCYKCQGSLVT